MTRIPKDITADDVRQAIADLRGGIPHSFGDSTKHDLVYEGGRYPPKAVLGLAARRALGVPLEPADFSGGKDSQNFRILKRLGFEIKPKQAAPRFWLLLEKSDETRVSQGIDGYEDRTGESYHYDSLVPNNKNLSEADAILLRKEDEILGVGRIGNITSRDDAKLHRRCPECNSTDVRERETKKPKWKCGRCSIEFEAPIETISDVKSFVATIEDFARLDAPPSVINVKRCAIEGDGAASQLSIMELDREKVATLLEGITLVPGARTRSKGRGGQGFGLSKAERDQVERRAMQVARDLYEKSGWVLVDTSIGNPFDFLATKGTDRRYLEVKGTTGEGSSIELTHGEVRHVQQNERSCALVVVAEIRLAEADGKWAASGGRVVVHEDPWSIDESVLEATRFRYSMGRSK